MNFHFAFHDIYKDDFPKRESASSVKKRKKKMLWKGRLVKSPSIYRYRNSERVANKHSVKTNNRIHERESHILLQKSADDTVHRNFFVSNNRIAHCLYICST